MRCPKFRNYDVSPGTKHKRGAKSRVKKLSVTRDQSSIFFLEVYPILFLGLDLIDPRSSLKNLDIIKCYDIASPSINWIWKIILVVMCQFRGVVFQIVNLLQGSVNIKNFIKIRSYYAMISRINFYSLQG